MRIFEVRAEDESVCFSVSTGLSVGMIAMFWEVLWKRNWQDTICRDKQKSG